MSVVTVESDPSVTEHSRVAYSRKGSGRNDRRPTKAPLARRAAGAGGDHHQTKAAVTRAHLSLRPTARVAV